MPFNELEIQKIKKYVGGLCEKRSPNHLRDQLRNEYRIFQQDVILVEIRPYWKEPKEIVEQEYAKLKYIRSRNIWKLYWKRASGKWHLYEPSTDTAVLIDLVKEIDEDANGCFFG